MAGGELAAGETLETSRIREEIGIIVIAIKRADGEMLFNPSPDARIEVGNRLGLGTSLLSLCSTPTRWAS